MSKYTKFKKTPKLFFYDYFKKRFFKKEPLKEEPLKEEPLKKEPLKKEPLKKEPLLFATTNFKDMNYKLEVFKKVVINQNLGFSSLVITEKDSEYLINKAYISLFLKDKSFIAFKDKSMYFLRDDIKLNHIIFDKKMISELFLNQEVLRQNKFSMFRNIISINTLSPTPILIKNSNPFIRLICIIDNSESLEYIKNYISDIDVLILKDQTKHLRKLVFTKKNDYSLSTNSLRTFDINKWIFFIPKTRYEEFIPRIVKFSNEFELLNITKTILIDNSYKTDSNVLLPVVTSRSNLNNIDLFNKNKVQGLIHFKYKNINNINSFDTLIENFDIEELYLTENLYSLYKDMIFSIKNQNDLKALLKKTLYDGVFYEEI